MNATLRQNIVMGSEWDENWYWEVVFCCGLQPDLQVLPGKDMTEIGQKGINLSGGQKARVCLARAVYSKSETILLDDPLSSVDSHVAKHIVKHCILGLLKNKTRFLVTHRLEFLQNCDYVITMKEGKIQQITSPDLVLKKQTTEEQAITKAETSDIHKLIQDQDKQVGKVSRDIYKKYFKYSGSYLFIILAIISMIIWGTTVVIGDIYLKQWSQNPDNSRTLMKIYSGLRIGGCLFIFVRVIILGRCMSIRISKKIHQKMIDKLLKAPINHFYDVTPSGTILNRLTKDQNQVDQDIAPIIGTILASIVASLGIIILELIYFPFLIVVFPVVFYLCSKLAQFYLASARELRRFQSVSKSDILNIFNECLSGAKIIRCFGKVQRFQKRFCKSLDKNGRITYNLFGTLS